MGRPQEVWEADLWQQKEASRAVWSRSRLVCLSLQGVDRWTVIGRAPSTVRFVRVIGCSASRRWRAVGEMRKLQGCSIFQCQSGSEVLSLTCLLCLHRKGEFLTESFCCLDIMFGLMWLRTAGSALSAVFALHRSFEALAAFLCCHTAVWYKVFTQCPISVVQYSLPCLLVWIQKSIPWTILRFGPLRHISHMPALHGQQECPYTVHLLLCSDNIVKLLDSALKRCACIPPNTCYRWKLQSSHLPDIVYICLQKDISTLLLPAISKQTSVFWQIILLLNFGMSAVFCRSTGQKCSPCNVGYVCHVGKMISWYGPRLLRDETVNCVELRLPLYWHFPCLDEQCSFPLAYPAYIKGWPFSRNLKNIFTAWIHNCRIPLPGSVTVVILDLTGTYYWYGLDCRSISAVAALYALPNFGLVEAVKTERPPAQSPVTREKRPLPDPKKREDFYANVGEAIRVLRAEIPTLFQKDLTCKPLKIYLDWYLSLTSEDYACFVDLSLIRHEWAHVHSTEIWAHLHLNRIWCQQISSGVLSWSSLKEIFRQSARGALNILCKQAFSALVLGKW